MKHAARWVFYVLMIAYIAYNAMWLIGITFSYSKNDSLRELIYPLLTFVVDVPIIWYLSRNILAGSVLLATALALSVADGIAQHLLHIGLEEAIVPLMWYAPKILPVAAAILLYRSRRSVASLA